MFFVIMVAPKAAAELKLLSSTTENMPSKQTGLKKKEQLVEFIFFFLSCDSSSLKSLKLQLSSSFCLANQHS
jgi:hypothetical protein